MMKEEKPHRRLDRLLHEPNRMAIMSSLCGARRGLSFNELKEACVLTDGNLSRHLKKLEEASMIQLQKTFVGVKPRTTVILTSIGESNFMEYLKNLEKLLKNAAEAMENNPSKGRVSSPFPTALKSAI